MALFGENIAELHYKKKATYGPNDERPHDTGIEL